MKLVVILVAATIAAAGLFGCSGSPTNPGPVSPDDTNALLALYENLPVGSSYSRVQRVLKEVSGLKPDPYDEGWASASAPVSLFETPSTVTFRFEQTKLVAIVYAVAGMHDTVSLEPISSAVDEFYDTRLSREGCGSCWVLFGTGIRMFFPEDHTHSLSWVITSGELASRFREGLGSPGDDPNLPLQPPPARGEGEDRQGGSRSERS